MPITVRPPAPNSVQDNVALPPKVPVLPDDVFERFPSLRTYQEAQNKWWTRTSSAIQQFAGSVGDDLDEEAVDSGDLFVQFNDFTASITTQVGIIATELAIQAKRIVTVSAMSGVSQNIKVQNTAPVSPVLNDYWINNTDLLNAVTYQWDGLAWTEVTTPISAAAVADERTARVTADGFLEGKYTLTVIAGNVVTGMNITSASGAGTIISSVIFRATDFQIYDGTLGVTPFQVIGGTVRVSGLTILGGDIVGGVGDVTLTAINGGLAITGGGLQLLSGGAAIRGGQTAYNTGTGFWLGDVAGTSKFSIGNPAGSHILWDGTTLTITGGAPSIAWADITGRPGELTDGRIPIAISAAGLVVSGVIPGINVTTGAAGLYLGADFMGYYNGAAWRTYMDNAGNFYLGGTAGALQWNGTTLTITGNITLTNTIPNTSVSGLGALATQSSVSYGSITGTKPPSNADVTLSAINGSLTITGGGLVLASGGASIRGGQTAYNTGTGFWLGDLAGTSVFSIGNSAGNRMTWNGSILSITGTLTATAGTIGGFTLGPTFLTSGSGLTYAELNSSSSPFLRFGTLSGTAAAVYSIIGWTIAGSSGLSAADCGLSGNAGLLRVYNSGGASTITLNGLSGNVSCSSLTSGGGLNGVSGGVSGSWAVGGGSGNPVYASSGRLYFGAAGVRWYISDGSGDLVALASYAIKKDSSDGWSIKLVDGSASIEFRANGGDIEGRINGGSALVLS